MSKYRFLGTLKENKYSSGNTILSFIPNQECAVTENCGDSKVKYAVFLPKEDGEGMVFACNDKVSFEVKSNPKCLPNWKPDVQYSFVLSSSKKANADIEVEIGSGSKCFKLEAVIEKA